LIHLRDVDFSYESGEGKSTFALDGINLSVPSGAYAALIGPNGSGKTTIAKLIKGIVSPVGGEVEVAGKILGSDEISEDVGLVFSNPENQIVSAVVEEDVAFGLENMGIESGEMRRRVTKVMERLNLKDLAKMPPHKLSGGEQQRLVIAGVLVMGLKVMVLDEATSMLDSMGRRDILKLIRELNRSEAITVLSITHSISEAVLADLVFVIDDGRVVFSGTPKELLFDDAILRRLKIDLSEFLQLIKGLIDEGIDLPDGHLGVESTIDVLNGCLREDYI
jgi:energy-coupling factor transport system ATP-binding protein